MTPFDSRICFGFNPAMLFPGAFDDPLIHFASIRECCHYPGYETFETYLPDDRQLRTACLREMVACEKKLHYNAPGVFQVDGPYNPGSDDPSAREQALCLAKMHVDFASEAESPVFVMTGCPDKGPEQRPEILKRFQEYFLKLAEHCRQYRMELLIEPTERHRFKKLILGPSEECRDFLLDVQRHGACNAHPLLDVAHLPLMEESFEQALSNLLPAGIRHIHLGDAVLDPARPFYGHMHPPIGVQGGTFDYEALMAQFTMLFECGYLPRSPKEDRALISLEVRAYPGCTARTSIQLMYEKVKSACDTAAGLLNIY